MDMQMGSPGSLHLARDTLCASFDHVPFGFTHDLHRSSLFSRDGLAALARRYTGHSADYFVAGSASSPGTVFYAVPTIETTPADALARLDAAPTRLLLKRPEQYDPAFHALLDGLFEQVADLHCGLRRKDILRLESAILVTSAASTTPFHFDPEIGFFSQIEGEKTYHVYAPDSLTEPELETFYRAGKVDIGQVDLARRSAAKDYAFALVAGRGLHQPQNAPHWVQTHGSRSVSYTMVFETHEGRRRSRARGFNHYLRRAGLQPRPPGSHPVADTLKARTMQVMARARRAAA